MKKDFRFFLDGIELNYDIENYSDIKFKLGRDSKYWGYFRMAVLETLVLVKTDAKRLLKLWNKGNMNSEISFRIETINRNFDRYEVFQDSIVEWGKFKELIDVNNKKTVSVGLLDSAVQAKLRGRESLELVIGDSLSVESEDINGFALQYMTINRKVLRQEATFIWKKGFQQNNDVPQGPDCNGNAFLTGFNIIFNGSTTGDSIHTFAGLEIQQSNIGFAQSTLGKSTRDVVLGDQYTYYPIDQIDLFLTESARDRQIFMEIDLDFTMRFEHNNLYNQKVYPDISGTVADSDKREFNIGVKLIEYKWNEDENTYFYESTVFDNYDTLIANHNGFDNPSTCGGFELEFSEDVNFNGSFTFTKKKDSAYGFKFYSQKNPNTYDTPRGYVEAVNGDNFVYLRYDDADDEFPSTDHKAVLVGDAFNSLGEQITDRQNVVRSFHYGVTENGYATDGAGSMRAITNGLYLRNAINSDESPVNLTLQFAKLFESMTAIDGLAIWWDGTFINIEPRSEAFGNNEIELNPSEITSELITSLIYTGVIVGNEQIEYENINGTNEHNTILHYSTPIRTKENILVLKTAYNTDGLGMELARRLGFANSNNTDTKYDDKSFIFEVKRKAGGGFELVIGFDGYDIISGVVLPAFTSNIGLSPRNMLDRNKDLVALCFWKINDKLTFKKSENLSKLTSRKIGKSTVIEQSDMTKAQMGPDGIIPMVHSLSVGMKDILQVVKNPFNYFSFYKDKKKISGELWDITIQNKKGTIKIIQKL